DPGTVLGAVAARQEPRTQPDRNRQYAWYPQAEFRGDAGWPGEPRFVRADTFEQRSPLSHPGPDGQGPRRAGARQEAHRRQARSAPRRIAGTGQPRRAAGNAGHDRKRVLKLTSFRGGAKRRTRNLEIPGLVLRTIPE